METWLPHRFFTMLIQHHRTLKIFPIRLIQKRPPEKITIKDKWYVLRRRIFRPSERILARNPKPNQRDIIEPSPGCLYAEHV